MANQGIGQFAGAFAKAFSNARSAKADRKERKDIAAQTAKLIQMQIDTGKVKLDANTKLIELMTGQGRLEEFEPTAPVQTPTGETRSVGFTNDSGKPMGLPEMMSGGHPEAMLALIQSDSLDVGDILKEQGLAAGREQTAEMFASGSGSSGRVDAAGNPEFIPGPSSMQISSDGKLVTNRPQAKNPLFVDSVAAAKGAQSVEHAVTQVDDAMRVMGSLEGSVLQSGSPLGDLFGDAQSLASAFGASEFLGLDETAPQRRQRAKKLFADNLLTNEQMAIMRAEGNVTDAKLKAVAASSADLNNGILANGLQMLDALEIKVKNADILGIPMSDPEGILQQIEERRAKITDELFGTPPSGSTFFDDAQAQFGTAKEKASGAIDIASQQVAAIGSMSGEKLLELQQSGAVLSDEVRAASIERFNELNKAAQDSFNDLVPQVEAIGKMGLGQLQQLQKSGVTLAGDTKKALDARWKELAPGRKMLALKAAMEIGSARESVSKQVSVIKTFTLDELAQLGESGLKLADEVRRETERRWDELDVGQALNVIP